MTARLLLPVFDTVYLLALSAWVGGVAFFLLGMTPIQHRNLDARASGAPFLRALRSRYYAWGVMAGAIALPAMLGGPLSFPAELRGPAVGMQATLILAGILIMLYGGNSLTPAMDAAHVAGAAGAVRLAALEKRSVWLNSIVLLLGISLLAAFVLRPAPKTSGLADPSPQERAQKSFESFSKRQADFEAARRKRPISPP